MKILMSAYSCEPGQGSERGLGWSVASEVAKHHQVWVLTRPDESQEAIEAELESHPIPNLKFVYFTLPFWQDSLRWGQSGAMQIHYYLWQIQAYFIARKLHQEIGFDVAHHVTFVKYSSPSFLSLLPIPFIWGPVGGGETAPKPFWQDFSLKAKIYETLRDSARRLGEFDPFVRVTARNSAAIKATTKDTAERLQSLGVKQVEIISESSLTEAEIADLAQYQTKSDRPLRFISIGRLLHWKGFHLGLRGFAEANLPDAEYWLVGDGAERQRLEALAKELGIAAQVKFWGRLPRQETLEKLGQCQVLVHPSLHDSGGWVCLEGMAAKKPVLCLNLGGPGAQVTEATGIRVAPQTPEQVATDLALAMKRLANDQELRQTMGAAGSQLVQEKYSLTARGRELSQLYTKLSAGLVTAV
ncbi:MAG: glycosyltransferase family 4 protein [Cyanobacteria bacterium J06643_13]